MSVCVVHVCQCFQNTLIPVLSISICKIQTNWYCAFQIFDADSPAKFVGASDVVKIILTVNGDTDETYDGQFKVDVRLCYGVYTTNIYFSNVI